MSFCFRVIEETGEQRCFHFIAFIVYPQIVCRNIGNIYNYGFEAIELHAFFIVCSKDERFAMFHEKRFLLFSRFLGEDLKRTIVKYVAVLVNFYKRGSVMFVRAFQNSAQVDRVAVHRTCNERSACSKYQRQRIERMVNGSEGS